MSGIIDERVVGGNPVRRITPAVRVDAENLAEKLFGVLRPLLGIARGATVTEAEVQHVVGPEHDVPAVVVLKGLIHLDQRAARAEVHLIDPLTHRELVEATVAAAVGEARYSRSPSGENARPSSPRSPSVVVSPERSTSGALSTSPPLSTRTRPARSAT